jgi:hypothetical protein
VVFYDSGPVFEMTDGFKGTVLASYPQEKVLASGFLQGESLSKARSPRSKSSSAMGESCCSDSGRSGAAKPFGTFA